LHVKGERVNVTQAAKDIDVATEQRRALAGEILGLR
jgi:hypothetical protein